MSMAFKFGELTILPFQSLADSSHRRIVETRAVCAVPRMYLVESLRLATVGWTLQEEVNEQLQLLFTTFPLKLSHKT